VKPEIQKLMRVRSLVVLFWWVSIRLSSQPAVRVDSLYSASIGTMKPFTILLPAEYRSDKRYPVLYLLHGYFGNHTDWNLRTALKSYLGQLALVVVLPDGENSWYANSYSEPGRRFEDYVVNDLLTYVAVHYSVDTLRQGIAGLSMGGYGAVMLALKHPRTFQFAGSLSGAFSFPHFLEDSVFQPLPNRMRSAAQDIFGPLRSKHRAEYDPFFLLRKSKGDSLPYFYFATGIQDDYRGFLSAQRMLTDSMRALHVSYEYHETAGRHNWSFWDREIQPLLKRLSEVLKL
jgi:putative tributyrin esterase